MFKVYGRNGTCLTLGEGLKPLSIFGENSEHWKEQPEESKLVFPRGCVTQADVTQAGSCLPTPTESVSEGNGAIWYHGVKPLRA